MSKFFIFSLSLSLIHYLILLLFSPYLPIRIDGIKDGPILIGSYNPEDSTGRDWLNAAKPSIESRMNSYAANETHFALLSFVPHRLSQLEREINALQEVLSCKDELMEDPTEMEENLIKLQDELLYEKEIEEKNKKENIRRRHDYTPFILSLLKGLAKKNELSTNVKNAKEICKG